LIIYPRMKRDSQKMREVISYMRGCDVNSHQSRDRLGAKLIQLFEAEYMTEGVFSKVYEVAGFVVKIGCDDFSSLKNLRRTREFNEFAPKIYWTHPQGFSVVCEKVKIKKYKHHDEAFRKAYEKIIHAFKPLGVEPWDLHPENLVLSRGKPSVVDYGCFMQP
jgi:hypothetical protein